MCIRDSTYLLLKPHTQPAAVESKIPAAVSYTHLDVYKRQALSPLTKAKNTSLKPA